VAQHIAEVDWKGFLRSSLDQRFWGFLDCVYDTTYSDRPVKRAFHQACRLVWLSDQLRPVTQGRPAIHVWFYMVAAEAVTSVVLKFEKGELEGPRKKVHFFFSEICSDEERAVLSNGFRIDGTSMKSSDVVDYLYDIRNDVAHEGQYWALQLEDEQLAWKGGRVVFSQSTRVGRAETSLRLDELRAAILSGAVRASARLLPEGDPCLGLLPGTDEGTTHFKLS
jgi:hypothetical protein